MDKKCPYCEKTISGQSEKQVDFWLKIHIINKHSDRVQIATT